MSEHRLSEITIERPRGGMRRSPRKMKGAKKRLERITQEAAEDGLLSPYLIKSYDKSKWLSDHLGPLRRFLRSHVGQPWNDVYSKLCRKLNPNTLAGQHVISHLWDFVERHVELVDGIPHRKTHQGIWNRLDHNYGDQFYVHPETGVLCLTKKQPSRHPSSPSDRLMIDRYHRYQKLNNIWYQITLEDFPSAPNSIVKDVLKGMITHQDAEYIQGIRVYAAKKKQCNKKEIRCILSQLQP